ncbi:thiamine pyrophosphate-dependent acetolactate synthase large subunit-like protein [Bradyrhizobium sp. S3.2.6]
MPPRIMPHDEDLDRAAEILNSGTKVAMLIGAGALAATDDVIAVADRLGAGCANALLARQPCPTTCHG